MVTFEGYLDRRGYAIGSMVRLALFAVSVLGFPLVMLALKAISKCGHDTCAAVGLVGAMAFKPLAFALLTFSFVGISMRRVRDAGVPGWIGLFIPLLFMADSSFLVFYAAPWSFAFSSGQLGISTPLYALLAVGSVAILSVMPSRDGERGNPFGYIGWITFGLGIFIAIFAFLAFAFSIPGIASMIAPLAMVGFYGKQILLVPMAGFLAGLIWIACQDGGDRMPSPRVGSAPSAFGKLPLKTLAATSVVLTVAAIFLAIPASISLPLFFVVQFTQTVLPTFLLYFCVATAVYLTVKSRNSKSALILAVSLAPLAHWAYAHWSTAQQHKLEAAKISAIETKRIAHLPSTMVIDSEHVTATRAAFSIPGVNNVVLRGAYGSKLMQVNRPRPEDRWFDPGEISSLPKEYLELRIGRSSRFAIERQMYTTAGGPFELRRVDSDHNELLAVWYQTYNPSPSRLPILTTNGWLRHPNSATSDEIDATVSGFLARALSGIREG
ncbi:MAG: hypothetical protein ABL907_04105 [Hyphomicrobium sp.]